LNDKETLLLTEDLNTTEVKHRVDLPFRSMSSNIHDLDSKKNQLIFLLFGFGYLLPWNAIMAAMDYFVEKYPAYQP
jgi:hypothetical protein